LDIGEKRMLFASLDSSGLLCTASTDKIVSFWKTPIKNPSWEEIHEKDNLIRTDIR
jgi:hypothetical protein